MQFQPTAGGVASSGTVRGLGVTDALELELDPVQIPWLIDELDEVRNAFEEQLQHLPNAGTGDALEQAQDQVRVLRLMRAQLPASDCDGRVAFVGPTALMLDLVRGTMLNVASTLSELVHGRSAGDPQWHARVHATAAAAYAWVRTYLDCEAVELFAFEADAEVTAVESGKPLGGRVALGVVPLEAFISKADDLSDRFGVVRRKVLVGPQVQLDHLHGRGAGRVRLSRARGLCRGDTSPCEQSEQNVALREVVAALDARESRGRNACLRGCGPQANAQLASAGLDPACEFACVDRTPVRDSPHRALLTPPRRGRPQAVVHLPCQLGDGVRVGRQQF